MGWIKRNLFFVVGGSIALVLLGGAGFYIYQGYSKNSDASGKLADIYSTLKQLADEKPGPGANNAQLARDQEKQLKDWIHSTSGYFLPISPIPDGNVTSERFAAALRRTLAQLTKDAQASGVMLPPEYMFSFDAQKPLMQFAAGSLDPLAQQLGEVKAISELIFSAQVNSLDSIQRVHVSDDDINGPQSDYAQMQPFTNDMAILTPYVISFRSFSPEIAKVLCAFANSSNEFIVHSINVEPASNDGGADQSAGQGMPNGAYPNQMPGNPGNPAYPGYPPATPGYPPALRGYPGYPPATPAPQGPASARGGLQTVLKEQLLRTTMEVEIVKLLPNN